MSSVDFTHDTFTESSEEIDDLEDEDTHMANNSLPIAQWPSLMTPITDQDYVLWCIRSMLYSHTPLEQVFNILHKRHIVHINRLLFDLILHRNILEESIMERLERFIKIYLKVTVPDIEPFKIYLKNIGYDIESPSDSILMDSESITKQDRFLAQCKQLYDIHRYSNSWGITNSYVHHLLHKRQQLAKIVKITEISLVQFQDMLEKICMFYCGLSIPIIGGFNVSVEMTKMRQIQVNYTIHLDGKKDAVILMPRSLLNRTSTEMFGYKVSSITEKSVLIIERGLSVILSRVLFDSDKGKDISLVGGYLFGHWLPENSGEKTGILSGVTDAMTQLKITDTSNDEGILSSKKDTKKSSGSIVNSGVHSIVNSVLDSRVHSGLLECEKRSGSSRKTSVSDSKRRTYKTEYSVEDIRDFIKTNDKIEFTKESCTLINDKTPFITTTKGTVISKKGTTNCRVKLHKSRTKEAYVKWNGIIKINDHTIKVW